MLLVMLFPVAPVHVHLYMTYMGQDSVSSKLRMELVSGGRDGCKALQTCSVFCGWCGGSPQASAVSGVSALAEPMNRASCSAEGQRRSCLSMLLNKLYCCCLFPFLLGFKDLICGALSCNQSNPSLISKHSSPKFRFLFHLLSWCIPQLLNF